MRRAQTSDLVNSGRFLARLRRKEFNVVSVQLTELQIESASGSMDKSHSIASAARFPCKAPVA